MPAPNAGLDADPILKSVTVPLDAEAAFDLFARRIDSWWPAGRHSASARSGTLPRSLTIEPFKGGRILEITSDGRAVVWGQVIAWDPGRYLAFTWAPEGDEDGETVVAISFVPTPEGTRLDLAQGAPAAVLGELADAVSTTRLRGWRLVLGCYSARASLCAPVPA